MISQKAIDEMSKDTDVAWITALRSDAIRTLVQQVAVRMVLFDERHLVEISSPDFPGERLVARRNPELAKLRAHTRDDLLAAIKNDLQGIQARVAAGKSTLRAAEVGRCSPDRCGRGQGGHSRQGRQAF